MSRKIAVRLLVLALVSLGASSGFATEQSPDDDPLRPFSSSRTRTSAKADSRGYSRTEEPARAATVRERRPKTAVDFYPTMRVGQGPNRNVVDTRHLCVPGRRAMLYR